MIVESTRDAWGAEQAVRYRRSLRETCDRLASYPELAPVSSELGDVRVVPVERHRIVYRPEGDGVRVLRVVHQRMRLEDVDLG